MTRLIVITTMASILVFPTFALAQENKSNDDLTSTSQDAGKQSIETDEPITSIEAAKECNPLCRREFVCIEGKCVNRCNPPCAYGEVCSGRGECNRLPSAVGSTQSYTISLENEQTLRERDIRYNNYLVKEYEYTRNSGHGLLIGSVLLLCTSIPFYVAAEKRNLPGLRNAALVFDLLGTVMLISGIAMAVTGANGIEQAQKGLFRAPPEFR